MIILVGCSIVILYYFYRRYYPVFGVHHIHFSDLVMANIEIIDVRDYNNSFKEPSEDVINIPIAYLKRYYHEIPNRDLHLVVSSLLEKNMATRFLKKKGFKVVGYTIIKSNKVSINENKFNTEMES